MAQFRTYRCRCGFEIQTEPLGHYSLMSGEYNTFRCHKCNDIVAISAEDIAQAGYNLTCPECGSDELECWSINSRCPKCNSCGSFVEIPGGIMMVD